MPRPATVPISRTKWAILFSEQGGCCAGCFKPLGEDVHVDHVNPLARKGEDRFENLQRLHAACNLEQAKGAGAMRWRAASADAFGSGRAAAGGGWAAWGSVWKWTVAGAGLEACQS